MDITKHPKPGSRITQGEGDDTIYEVHINNHCNMVLAFKDEGEEVNEDRKTEWMVSAEKSLKDGEYIMNPICLGLCKYIRVISLVILFINKLRKRIRLSERATEATSPITLLTYIDPYYMGMKQRGFDTLHSIN